MWELKVNDELFILLILTPHRRDVEEKKSYQEQKKIRGSPAYYPMYKYKNHSHVHEQK